MALPIGQGDSSSIQPPSSQPASQISGRSRSVNPPTHAPPQLDHVAQNTIKKAIEEESTVGSNRSPLSNDRVSKPLEKNVARIGNVRKKILIIEQKTKSGVTKTEVAETLKKNVQQGLGQLIELIRSNQKDAVALMYGMDKSTAEVAAKKILESMTEKEQMGLMEALFEKEAKDAIDPTTFLRGDNITSKLLTKFTNEALGKQFDEKISELAKKHLNKPLADRINGAKGGGSVSREDQAAFKKQLDALLGDFSKNLLTEKYIPPKVSNLFLALENVADRRGLKGKQIAGQNFYLRIMTPKLLDSRGPVQNAIQKIANGATFATKEPHLKFMDDLTDSLIQEIHKKMGNSLKI